MLRACSATARARLDLPTPGRPLKSTLEPASRESERLVASSSLPCRDIGSGRGPKLRPLRAREGSSSPDRTSRPRSVMCTTVRRRVPPPMTWAERVETWPSASSAESGACSADLTTPRDSARPGRDNALGTSQAFSSSPPNCARRARMRSCASGSMAPERRHGFMGVHLQRINLHGARPYWY